MSDDEVLDLEHSARKRLIVHFRETGEERFLLAAAQLRTKSDDLVSFRARLRALVRPHEKGRPEVPGERDRLVRMAVLVDRGLAANPTEAARLIAEKGSAGAGTHDSIVRRLRVKFIEHRPYLTELVTVLRALEGPTPEIQALTASLRQDKEHSERMVRAFRLAAE